MKAEGLVFFLVSASVLGQLPQVITNNMAYFNPLANPTVPYCVLGNTPVCSREPVPRTLVNRCVLILLGLPFGSNGWCAFEAPAAVAGTAAAEPQGEENGFPGPFAVIQADATCTCTQVRNPVCGADGVTYINFCTVKKCSSTSFAAMGPCGGAQTPSAVIQFCDSCPLTVSLFCGNDDVTYQNECVAKCLGASSGSQGRCTTPCNCAPTNRPVCSVGLKNYRNKCYLDCAKDQLGWDSPCPDPTPAHCSHCAGFTSPVCGANGMTYDNQCYLDCSGVALYANNACPSTKTCKCDKKLYLPVCGIDGRTYDSECLLGCTNVRKAYNGVCKDSNSCSKCPKTKDLICGRDGKTYQNECFLQCKGIQPLYRGSCEAISSGNCLCPNTGSSVCGKDSKSYKSECFAKCLGTSTQYPGTCGAIGSGCESGCGGISALPPQIVPIYQAYQQYFPNGQPINQQALSYQQYFASALSPYAASLGIAF